MRPVLRVYRTSTDMHVRSLLPIRLCSPEYFSGYRGGDFPFADEQEPEQVDERVAFGPFEVHIRVDAGDVPDSKQDGGNCVGGDRGTVDPQNPVFAALTAVDDEVGAEVGGVGDVHFEEEDGVGFGGDMLSARCWVSLSRYSSSSRRSVSSGVGRICAAPPERSRGRQLPPASPGRSLHRRGPGLAMGPPRAGRDLCPRHALGQRVRYRSGDEVVCLLPPEGGEVRVGGVVAGLPRRSSGLLRCGFSTR